MEVEYYNPKFSIGLMSACTEANLIARTHNCIVQMNWCGVQYTCNPDITASRLYNHIINCIKKQS